VRPSPRNRIAPAENGPMPGISSNASRASAYGAVRRNVSPSAATARTIVTMRSAFAGCLIAAATAGASRRASSASSGIAYSVRPRTTTACPNRSRNARFIRAAAAIGARCIIVQ